jgi:hypothetical protein
MRTGILFALSGAAMLAFVGVSNAAPLAATSATNVAIQNAMADEGVTQVHYRKRYHRHHRWNRGHHYGWRHRHHHHRHVYGYAPRHRHHHHHSGVTIRIR